MNFDISSLVIYLINFDQQSYMAILVGEREVKELGNLIDFKKLLSKNKISSRAAKEILKWYDYHEKKGVASF
jgi:hypothetical protein